MKWYKQKSTEFFSPEISKLMVSEGIESVGLYYFCLQLIAMDVSESNLTFELKHDSVVIASMTGMGIERVEHLMRLFVKLGLFENAQGTIKCIRLMQLTDEYTTKLLRKKTVEINDLSEIKDCPDKVRSIRLDKIRLDKTRIDNNIDIRGKKTKRFSPPSLEEVKSYFMEKGVSHSEAERQSINFIDFYTSKDWMIGKNKMKKWKSSVSLWINRNKIKPDNNMHTEDWTK